MGWPDDILQAANYKPLVWGGESWVAPDQKFGAASIKVENGNITLGLRSAWGANGDEAGDKLGAVAFIAPATGRYTLALTARAGIWQGDGGVTMQILKRSGNTLARLRTFPLPKDQDVPFASPEIELAAGDEIVLTAKIEHWYTGVNLSISGLKINFTGK